MHASTHFEDDELGEECAPVLPVSERPHAPPTSPSWSFVAGLGFAILFIVAIIYVTLTEQAK